MGLIQISFGGINNGAGSFQTLEIPDCAREEKAKDEIGRSVKPKLRFC